MSTLGSNEQLGAVSEARRPTALLIWSLYVDCPNCSLSNDLANGPPDFGGDIEHHIFSNQWDKLEGWEVTCEGCGYEFLLAGVEY